MDFEDMFGNGGIYIAGQSVEKPISMEWINPHTDVNLPNEVPGFQTDGTVQIVGGSSPNSLEIGQTVHATEIRSRSEIPYIWRGGCDAL